MKRNAWPVLLLCVPLAACGGEGEPAVRSTSEDFCRTALARVDSFMAGQEQPRGERHGGIAVVGGLGEIPDGMNGFAQADLVAAQHQTFVHLMTLIRYDESLEPVPYLAEAWELSEDGTELTFHLRDDVRWHDGEVTDAHDVAFTYRRATDPETAFPNAAFWTHYEQGEGGVQVVDSFTVRFRLRPHADPLDPWRAMPIMPEHLLGDVPAAELKGHPYGAECPVGNGPFRFVEHRQDASWTFERNPAFPEGLGGPPYLERYVYRVIPEQTTLLTELLTESVDVYLGVRPEHVRQIEEAEHLELRHFPWRGYVLVAWNSRRPQLADARVRRALTIGTNRAEIVEALRQGYGEVANTGVPPFHFAYDPSIGDSLAHDPAEARRLLEEAGWTDRDGDGIREDAEGAELSITVKYNQGNQERQDIAEIMQAQLRQVGVEVIPQVREWETLVGELTDPERRDFDGVVVSWINEFKVDDTDIFHSGSFDQPYAWSGTRVPEIDRLLDTLPLIAEREEAVPLWREYQSALLEHQPYTYFYFPERLVGVNRRLRDVEMDVRGEWINLGEWWIPAEERRGSERRAAGR